MEYAKALAPILIPLLLGTGFFTFILKLVWRFDFRSDSRNNEKRLYEIAYRRADGWSRQLAQLVAPAILVWKEADSREDEDAKELASKMLEILCTNLVELVDGKWHIKPHPEFLKEAHEELQRLKTQEQQYNGGKKEE